MPPEPARPQVVQRAAFRPGKCPVTQDIDGPFLDCGIKYENNGYWERLYLHLPWVEEMGRKHCGLVPRSKVEELEAELAEAKAEVESYKLALDALHDAKKEVVPA